MAHYRDLYIGIDIGGTKISACLVRESGDILSRVKIPTPRVSKKSQILDALSQIVKDAFSSGMYSFSLLRGIGIGVPGIVDEKGIVRAAPNIPLAGLNIAEEMKQTFKVRAIAGNDVNVGLFGEKWMGAARGVRNVVGLFPGTGVGGAAIIGGEMLTGAYGAGAEFGHMIVQSDGPKCNCGNRGCLEAVAGRWAIERDIRAEMKSGKKTKLQDLFGGKEDVIKSSLLKKAWEIKDPIVTRIMKKASQVLGLACVTLRHIFDPEMIVLGGGVIEACSEFMMPIIQKAVENDPFFSKMSECRIVPSLLGDDAVMLGAAALVMESRGVKLASSIKRTEAGMLRVLPGEVSVGGEIYNRDIYIRADGKVKKRSRKLAKESSGSLRKLGPEELEKICRKSPRILFIAMRPGAPLEITPEGFSFLKKEEIPVEILPAAEAVRRFNGETKRKKAILIRV